jgi:hypothetical protein
MPNYLPKGRERMRELGSRGGLKSGEVRRRNAFLIRMLDLYSVQGMIGENFTLDQIAAAMHPVDLSSSDHSTDWRYPRCGHFNSHKSHFCRECASIAPKNGSLTRAALLERQAEHKTSAILRKHGL